VQPEPARQEKKKKSHTGIKLAALALVFSLIGGMIGAAITNGSKTASGSTTSLTESTRTPVTVDVSYVPGQKEMTAAEVYAANVNATVGITTSIVSTNFFGYQTSSAAAGSGFIVTADGYIVTNYHVVEDSTSIQVTTYAGDTYDATLVGYDESNDLAVLKIDAAGLSTVVFGDSDALSVGDDVIAIGNPLGELTFSLTKGTVSALNREVTLSSDVTMNLIQTDAAINSGNSGGALFNMYGEVVGITNAKYSSSGSSGEASIDNIGFAIPISDVESIIKSIIEKGYYAKPYIGVYLSESEEGVSVYSVVEDGPAAAAGLKTGDVITAANGKEIAKASDLSALVGDMTPGDALTLTVLRDGETSEIALTVGEKQQSAQTAEESNQQTQPGYGNGNGYGYGSDGSSGYGFPFGFSGQPDRG
jgi:serine protease Do